MVVAFYGGAFLAGFVGFGLCQKAFGLRPSAQLLAGLVFLLLLALASRLIPSFRTSCRAKPATTSPSFALALALALAIAGCWWAGRHGGIVGHTLKVSAEATVIRRQPFTTGFNDWPYLLVATADRQFVVRGRHRPGESGWLSCLGDRSPCRFTTVTRRRFRRHPIKAFADRAVRAFAGSIAKIRPKSAARFYQAILLARPKRLASPTVSAFKGLGIYHLLVTSGLHFAILLRFIRLSFDLLLRGAYSATLITPYRWFFVRRLGTALSFGALVIYGLGIGLPAAVKRCLFMVGVSQLAALMWWDIPLRLRLLLSLMAASLIFPLGFFTTGSLLSWCCTLLLCLWSTHSQPSPQPKRSSFQALSRFALWQGQLVLMGFLLIGSYAPSAWLANGVIAVVFAPLLVVSFAMVACHALTGLDIGLGFAGSLAQQFTMIVKALDQLNPWQLTLTAARGPTMQLIMESAAVLVCLLSFLAASRPSEQPTCQSDQASYQSDQPSCAALSRDPSAPHSAAARSSAPTGS